MRNFFRLTVVSVALAAACSLGCSDGDKPKQDAGRTDARARTDAKVKGDLGTVTSACTNTADQAALNATYGDGGGRSIAEISTACGLACIAAPTQSCVDTCINNATKNGISAGCTGCFSVRLLCTIANCAQVCAAAPTSAACANCGCGNNPNKVNCVKGFTTCSGIPSTTECPSSFDAGVTRDGAVIKDAGAVIKDASHDGTSHLPD